MSMTDFSASPRGGKDGYLQHFFIRRQLVSQALCTISSIRDPKIPLCTDSLISTVTSESARETIYGNKSRYYQENLEESGVEDPSMEEKAQALTKACMRALGDVTSWYNDVFNITNTQTIGVCGVLPGEDEDEARFGGVTDAKNDVAPRNVTINLGAPLRGAKDGYLQLFFITDQNIAQMLANLSDIRDPKISLNTDYQISSIADEDDREAIYAKKFAYYDEFLSLLPPDPSEEEKAQALAHACIRVLGDVTSWYDGFIASTHSQTYTVDWRAADERDDNGGDDNGNIGDGTNDE
ncbi:MAG: hypothetical protein WC343_04560 [Bacilli bacterium]|jgi:hypothetical protein